MSNKFYRDILFGKPKMYKFGRVRLSIYRQDFGFWRSYCFTIKLPDNSVFERRRMCGLVSLCQIRDSVSNVKQDAREYFDYVFNRRLNGKP